MSHESKPPCPLCELTSQTYLFTRHGAPVVRCANCGLTRNDPAGAHTVNPGVEHSESVRPSSSYTERKAAEAYLATYRARGGAATRILAVVDDGHPFTAVAAAGGFTIETRVTMKDLEGGAVAGGPYHGAVVIFQLEKAVNPIAGLNAIHQLLGPGAVLLIVTPSLDSWPARVLRSQWTEWQPENRSYFDTQTIQSACLLTGFGEVEWWPYQPHLYARTSPRAGDAIDAHSPDARDPARRAAGAVDAAAAGTGAAARLQPDRHRPASASAAPADAVDRDAGVQRARDVRAHAGSGARQGSQRRRQGNHHRREPTRPTERGNWCSATKAILASPSSWRTGRAEKARRSGRGCGAPPARWS